MSIFKKLVKSNQSATASSSHGHPTSEEALKVQRLNEQNKYLNSYIQELVKENEGL